MNRTIKLIFRAGLLITAMVLVVLPAVSAEESDPIEIGSACDDDGTIYHLMENIQKTPWEISDLYAVPPGTLNPQAWELSNTFNSQFVAELQSGQDTGAYAHACTVIWQNFFSQEADIIVRLNRTITTTDQLLQCISENWTLVSSEPLELDDTSDWLTVTGSPFDVTNESTEAQLQNSLQVLVDNLNSQPGASSDPE